VRQRVELVAMTSDGRHQRARCCGALGCLYSCSSELRTKRRGEKRGNKNDLHGPPRPDHVQRIRGWQGCPGT